MTDDLHREEINICVQYSVTVGILSAVLLRTYEHTNTYHRKHWLASSAILLQSLMYVYSQPRISGSPFPRRRKRWCSASAYLPCGDQANGIIFMTSSSRPKPSKYAMICASNCNRQGGTLGNRLCNRRWSVGCCCWLRLTLHLIHRTLRNSAVLWSTWFKSTIIMSRHLVQYVILEWAKIKHILIESLYTNS